MGLCSLTLCNNCGEKRTGEGGWGRERIRLKGVSPALSRARGGACAQGHTYPLSPSRVLLGPPCCWWLIMAPFGSPCLRRQAHERCPFLLKVCGLVEMWVLSLKTGGVDVCVCATCLPPGNGTGPPGL